jgi:hypothetical protein
MVYIYNNVPTIGEHFLKSQSILEHSSNKKKKYIILLFIYMIFSKNCELRNRTYCEKENFFNFAKVVESWAIYTIMFLR